MTGKIFKKESVSFKNISDDLQLGGIHPINYISTSV